MADEIQTMHGRYVAVDCYTCAMVYYVPLQWDKNRCNDRKTFWCPNGHQMAYNAGHSEADQLRRELNNTKQQMARLEDEKRELDRRAARAHETARQATAKAARIQRRINAGVCPCCTRHFTNLERHMKTKHPDVVPMPKRA